MALVGQLRPRPASSGDADPTVVRVFSGCAREWFNRKSVRIGPQKLADALVGMGNGEAVHATAGRRVLPQGR